MQGLLGQAGGREPWAGQAAVTGAARLVGWDEGRRGQRGRRGVGGDHCSSSMAGWGEGRSGNEVNTLGCMTLAANSPPPGQVMW